MDTNNNSKNTLKVAIAVIVVAVLGFFGYKQMKENENDAIEPVASTSSNSNEDQTKYKNGTYEAEGSYVSPAGVEDVDVSLTIENDTITKVEFVGKTTNPTSKLLQGRFSTAYETMVVGKSVDEVNLTVVNGSSLTPKGFMDALSKIKVEAQS